MSFAKTFGHVPLVCVVLAGFCAAFPVAGQDGKSFPTYKAAADALYQAAKDKNQTELHAIFGSRADSILSSGEATSDESARVTIVKHYALTHTFQTKSDSEVVF